MAGVIIYRGHLTAACFITCILYGLVFFTHQMLSNLIYTVEKRAALGAVFTFFPFPVLVVRAGRLLILFLQKFKPENIKRKRLETALMYRPLFNIVNVLITVFSLSQT